MNIVHIVQFGPSFPKGTNSSRDIFKVNTIISSYNNDEKAKKLWLTIRNLINLTSLHLNFGG